MQRASRPWLSLIVLCLGTFAVLLDATIVNVALPSVITGLHASLDQALWVVNAYLLVFAALLIVASRLGDMFGPRRLFTAGLALFAVAALAGFVAWERRHTEPLVPLGLFRSRTFAILVALNVAVQFALQSMLLVNSINLQSVLGMTAVHAGLTGLPLTLALTATAPFAGRLTDRLGGKYVLMAGLGVYALGIAGVAAVSSTRATSFTFAPVLLVAGLGMGAIFAPLATEAMRAAPPRLAGAASRVLNTGRQLGGTLGGAITGAVLATQLTSALYARARADSGVLPAAARPGFVDGFTRAARSGLQVGRGQSAASLPDGTPASLISQFRQLSHDVFTHGYVTAMRPTLAISVAILLAGAAACLLLRRHPAPGPAAIPPDGQAPGTAAAVSVSAR